MPRFARSLGHHAAVVALLVACVAGRSCTGQPGGADKGDPPHIQDLLNRFDQMTPAVRLALAGKAPLPSTEFKTAVRGDLVATVSAHGMLEVVNAQDVRCTVRIDDGDRVPIIQWLVEAGELVKKGDLLIQLDDAPFKEQLAIRKKFLATVSGEQRVAELTRQVNACRVCALRRHGVLPCTARLG